MGWTEIALEQLRIVLDTPLGADKFFVRNLNGSEGISKLFEFDLDLLSPDAEVVLDDMLGQSVTVQIMTASAERCFLNGIVTQIRQCAGEEALYGYEARVRPWLWQLGLNRDSRVFQHMTAPEIIRDVFDRSSVETAFAEDLQGEYARREYCVQYRESDLAFVSRLMEEEGIFYYFVHENGSHTLVLADHNGTHPPCPVESSFEMKRDRSRRSDQDMIEDFEEERSLESGVYVGRDYNFKTPAADLTAAGPGDVGPEVYDYPAGYGETKVGEELARRRTEGFSWRRRIGEGRGECRVFRSGHRFDLSKHDRSELDGKYVLVEVQHTASQAGELGTRPGPIDMNYGVSFRAIPESAQFRPPCVTTKPRIFGTQTAVVTGKAGEEIWTDSYGRIKVKFHWDRSSAVDETTSCWIRCGHMIAGKRWGQVAIPRIGQEVLVTFLEGDPDRPLVVGGVYNDEYMPPYTLPAEQTKATFKSRSSKEGGRADFNEIRFEDKKDAEEIYIHAERDHNQVTENDRSEEVGHDRSLDVGNNKSETVGASKSITVGADHSEQIGSNMTVSVGANLTETVAINYAETVGAAMELTVGGVMAHTVGGALVQTVGAAKTETVAGSSSVSVGSDASQTVSGSNTRSIGASDSTDVGANQSVSIGGDKSEAVAGKSEAQIEGAYRVTAKTISLEAEDEIVITAGSASITLKKSGDIKVNGGKINIEGSGDVVVKGTKIKEN